MRQVPKEGALAERLSSMVHMPKRGDLHQLHVELVTCFPALANVPSFLQEHLPHILSKCVPDTPIIAANSTQQCFMVYAFFDYSTFSKLLYVSRVPYVSVCGMF